MNLSVLAGAFRVTALLPEREDPAEMLYQLEMHEILVAESDFGKYVALFMVDNPSEKRFLIPQHLPADATFFIEAAEYGGAGHDKNTVVCGLQGERLVPRVLLKGNSTITTGIHGYLGLPAQIHTVSYRRKRDLLTINLRRLNMEPRNQIVSVQAELIWEGHPSRFKGPEHFGLAMEACIQKSQCQQCQHLHYAQF